MICLLVAEVVVEIAGADARGRGDVVGRDGCRARVVEKVQGGIQDPLTVGHTSLSLTNIRVLARRLHSRVFALECQLCRRAGHSRGASAAGRRFAQPQGAGGRNRVARGRQLRRVLEIARRHGCTADQNLAALEQCAGLVQRDATFVGRAAIADCGELCQAEWFAVGCSAGQIAMSANLLPQTVVMVILHQPADRSYCGRPEHRSELGSSGTSVVASVAVQRPELASARGLRLLIGHVLARGPVLTARLLRPQS